MIPTKRRGDDADVLSKRMKTSDQSTPTAPPQWQPASEHPRWTHEGETPITEITAVPQGWTPNEPDLRESDIDANIERCRERIKDGIMPQIFQTKLKRYLTLRMKQDDLLASEREELSLDVVKRLWCLKFIAADLERDDPDGQLANVMAIIKWYRWGGMEWSKDGLCTFWSNGQRISEPKRFNLQDYLKASRENEGEKGFWVEGFDGPSPSPMYFTFAQPPLPGLRNWHHDLRFEVRIPGQASGLPDEQDRGGHVMEFLEDSSSSVMTIYDHDVDILQQLHPSKIRPTLLTGQVVETSNGRLHVPSVLLEARIVQGADNTPISKWAPVQTGIMNDKKLRKVPRRITGTWWRALVWTVMAPNVGGLAGTGNMFVTSHKPDLSGVLPECDNMNAEPLVDSA